MSNRLGHALLFLSILGLTHSQPANAETRDESATVSEGEGLALLARDLVLELVENGPDELWTFHLSNTGSTPVALAGDPSLLWFDVTVPNRSARVTCRLPRPLWPKGLRRRSVTLLKPGERFSRRFDPRFFCFDDSRQKVLVVGAQVTPHFGWPEATQEVRSKGRRAQVTLPPSPPFVAWLPPPEAVETEASTEAPSIEGDGDNPAAGGEQNRSSAAAQPGAAQSATVTPAPPADSRPLWTQPTEGLEQISGAAIVLAPEYAVWSAALPPAPGDSLRLVMRAGSDAEDERSATVTVAVENPARRSQQLMLRRELFEYHVTGPDGSLVCGPMELGPPDHGSFSTLPARSVRPLTVRLIELCPPRALSRPGLYEVHARLNSRWSGHAFGLDAFVGTLETPVPALVRIRSGERPSFLRATPILPPGAGVSGEAAAAPGAGDNAQAPPGESEGPAEPNVDAPPEELPMDHEGPADLPSEAPPPTLVE